jgi:hypothetical protein
MKATVAISTPTGPDLLSVSVNDFDPFTVLRIDNREIHLTRDECRKVADALRAAALRESNDSDSECREGCPGCAAPWTHRT